ncbi:MAG: toll/interleukin-1 receptor domain-containing protein [Pseudomonadota bacterium]
MEQTTSETRIFISHIADEQAEIAGAKEFLEKTFGQSIKIFAASSWESVQPGDDWFKRIEDAISSSDVMLVFLSTESVNRPWILFETGAAWFSKKKVIPICYKGMIPSALPDPIRRLQAVDINAATPAESFFHLAQAIQTSCNLPNPKPIDLEELPVDTGKTGPASFRAWVMRPTAHVGETIDGVFKVGLVDFCDLDRAQEAGLDTNTCLYVRLYVEPATAGVYLNTIAPDKVAPFFENEDIVGKSVKAKLNLKTTHMSGGTERRPVPVIVIESVKSAGIN